MEILKIFVVALMPIINVLLIIAIGSILALNRFNILGESATKNLNKIVYFVFSPALVCCSLAQTTLKSLTMLWFMPINILLTYIIGTVLGLLLVKVTRIPHHLQSLVLGCCISGNHGTLIIIIVPSICKQKSNPFGDMNVCYRNALAYASLSLALGSMYVWSYTYHIIRIYSPKTSNEIKVDDPNANTMLATKSDLENLSTCSTGEMVTVKDRSQVDDYVDQEEVPKKQKIMKRLNILAEKVNLKLLFAPATIGAIVGLVIGVVPQLRRLLVGNTAPLHVIQDSMVLLGNASIPTMTLLIGANLVKGLKGFGKQLPFTIGIIVIRFIVLPAIGTCIVKGGVHFGLIHPDPLYKFLLLLQFAVPPAINISTIIQLFGGCEIECSVIMLASYSCAAVLVTLWSTFFMWLVL